MVHRILLYWQHSRLKLVHTLMLCVCWLLHTISRVPKWGLWRRGRGSRGHRHSRGNSRCGCSGCRRRSRGKGCGADSCSILFL